MYSNRDLDPNSRTKPGKTDENIVLSFLKSLVFLACVSGTLAYVISIQP